MVPIESTCKSKIKNRANINSQEVSVEQNKGKRLANSSAARLYTCILGRKIDADGESDDAGVAPIYSHFYFG